MHESKARDHSQNYVDRVRLGQSSLQNLRYYYPPRGFGWRQKSISNLDLSSNPQTSTHQFADSRPLRASRSLDYKRPPYNDDSCDITEYYWHTDPDKDYERLPQNYTDENNYNSTNLNQQFDFGSESCSLRRSRSLAVIREESFSDLQIPTTNNHRRSQLISRNRLSGRALFKERFTSSKQPSYYEHQSPYHHHHRQHLHHHQPIVLDRPLIVSPEQGPSPPDALATPPETTTVTRESDEYYENLKRLDAHQQLVWQNEKSDLESLNSEYFRNSLHQSESNGEKQRLYQSRNSKSTSHKKYGIQPCEESYPELSQSSIFPETTTTSSDSDDRLDSLSNSEQEYDVEKVEDILSKVLDEKLEVISLTDEQDHNREDNSQEKRTLIAYDAVYLSSEESSGGTIVEAESQESKSLLHISIEDICEVPDRTVEQENQLDHHQPDAQLYKEVVNASELKPVPVVDTKPKILAVIEKKKLRRLSDYANTSTKPRGLLRHLLFTPVTNQTTHQFIEDQFHSLPDINIGRSLKASERIDAKLRSSYHPKDDKESNQPVEVQNSESAAIYDSIQRFGRAHKKARQREFALDDFVITNDQIEAPKEAPSIQVESYSKEITVATEIPPPKTSSPINSFRIIVTDAQNNVIEDDSIDGHISSLNLGKEQAPETLSDNPQKPSETLTKTTLNRTPSKLKRLNTIATVRGVHTDVCKPKDRRIHNTYRARPAKVKANDSLRSSRKMSRPQVIQIVDKRSSVEQKHLLGSKTVQDEFLQKVDAIRSYWSNISKNEGQPRQEAENQPDAGRCYSPTKKDFILGGETNAFNNVRPLPTNDDFQSIIPSIEIVELDGDKQATIVKANPDEPVPEFDHIRYKVMKPNLFRNNILNRSKKEAQFDGLIQYLQEYSFQELLSNNNVVIVEPVRTKIERPCQNTKPDIGGTGGQNCKITCGANTSPTTAAATNPTNPEVADTQNKINKRHFFYQPVRVNRELLEEELPTPDTVRNVRKFFEENILPHKQNNPDTSKKPPSEASANEGPKPPGNRYRYLTIDTSFGNDHNPGTGTAGVLKKWDSVSLSSGISSGNLSSPCDCSHTENRPPQQEVEHLEMRPPENQDEDVRVGLHVKEFIRKHNAYGRQDLTGFCGDYFEKSNTTSGDADGDQDKRDELDDDELCESFYVSEDVLEKIRECGSSVTYFGGRVVMHSPPATGATLRIPRSKIGLLTCGTCLPNQCPRKDQLHDQFVSGIKFKLVKSNSCSSRLELIGTQRLNNHEQHRHPTTIGEDEPIDMASIDGVAYSEDDDDYPIVRRLVHRLETTGKINNYTGPRIIESQCIEKSSRPLSLMVERQKFESTTTQKRVSDTFTINNQMVSKRETATEPSPYVHLLQPVTVNNHISIPMGAVIETPRGQRMAGGCTSDDGNSDTALTNGKVRRNKNVDLAFTMNTPIKSAIKTPIVRKSKDEPVSTKVEVAHNHINPTESPESVVKFTTVKNGQTSINQEGERTSENTSHVPAVEKTFVRHYVANDKLLFTNRKYDDIEFEEFEVYDPTKENTEPTAPTPPNSDVAGDNSCTPKERTSEGESSISSDDLKSNPDECYDSLDDKL